MDFTTTRLASAKGRPALPHFGYRTGYWLCGWMFAFLGASCHSATDSPSGQAPDPGAGNGVQFAQYFSISAEGDSLWIRETDDRTVLWIRSSGEHDTSAVTERGGIHLQIPAKVATWSTTHAPHLRALGAEMHWCATGYLDRVDLDSTVSGVPLVNLGGDGGLDEESLLVSKADVLTSYPFGDPMQGVTERTGIPVMAFREYAEPHPLGRAEYIKVFGWLTGQQERADSVFEAIAERYNRIRKQGAEDAAQGRPSVFTGSEQGGGWTAPTGDGLVARLVEDAGGHYLLDDRLEAEMGLRREGRNVEMDREQFAVLATGADAWGKVVHAPEGWYMEDAVSDMSWIPLEGKLLFHCNTHEVDYFGQAILEPDRMLSDLHNLFHGDSLSLGGRYFQRTLPRP